MKELSVRRLEEASILPADLSIQLDILERHMIHHKPWFSYSYQPEAAFSIAYDDVHFFLKYYVTEKAIRAETKEINGPVWEDSCVEFFVSFDELGYYNLEFNCAGVVLAGFGQERDNRQLLSTEVIRTIKTMSVINKMSNGLVYWELVIAVPLQVFVFHPSFTPAGNQCRANFYKCGDLLPEPHFLAWSDIKWEEPNFHLSRFFGTLRFA